MTNATTRQPSVGWLVASWTAFAFACLSLLSYPVALFVRGQVVAVLEDFDTELPALTVSVVTLPQAMFFAAPLVLLIAMLTVQIAVRRKWAALIFHLLVLLVSVVAVGVMVFALFLPLVKGMKSVQ